MSKLLPILIKATGLAEHDILRIVKNAPVRYKTYFIKKRNGTDREISQPARELKILQRALVAELLNQLPVHPSAMAYRPGISIKHNALAHVGNVPILKFDFKDFFPSIVANDWERYCEARKLLEQEDIYLSTNILFHHRKHAKTLRLAIGAPSSPCLSNILMYDFDTRISDLVKADQVTYTRYADDLTFSAKRTGFLTGVEKALRQTIREITSPSLTINEAKTVLATSKYNRTVTGLVLANDGSVSLGHERKKAIRAAVHHAQQNRLSEVELRRLAGLLAFVQSAEPTFLGRLIEKYGISLISSIKSHVKEH